MDENLSILNWNVRGLNDPARRDAIRAVLDQMRCSIICIQESKLSVFSDAIRRELAGPRFDSHIALDANGTRGGVLLIWRSDCYTVDKVVMRNFSITARFSPVGGLPPWTLTTVYGPHDDARKQSFLNEVVQIYNSITDPWIIIGDYNLIKETRDKNNSNIDRRWMLKFRAALNSSNLHEIQLIGRKYTWSNEQHPPTLVRLDRAFCTLDWEMRFSAAKLLPQSTGISDHCPLLLVNEGITKVNRRFRYEGFWEYINGFREVVAQAWDVDVGQRSPISAFDLKLRRTKEALKIWSRNHVGDIQKQLAMVNEIILQLESAQDCRPLSQLEALLRRDLKSKTLGLSVLLKIKRRQRSRIAWLKAGDANTRFFHRKSNSRHRKNIIHSLHSPQGIVTSNEEMLELAHHHFDQIMGTPSPAHSRFNWVELALPTFDLSDLESPFFLRGD
jgi:exonuclease III